MSKYENSEWAKPEFVQRYVDNAENFIAERRRMLGILKSFYNYFIKKPEGVSSKILDLGCGDGILTREILKVDSNIDATLLDGSQEMLDNAKKLVGNLNNIRYINCTFQKLLETGLELDKYDFIISSLAIHHLTFAEKRLFFHRIYSLLNRDGAFLNIDVVSIEEKLEAWYLHLWEEWIIEREKTVNYKNSLIDIPRKTKENPDNLPDALDRQLELLKQAGFKHVDCYYKYGIFAVYGGFRE